MTARYLTDRDVERLNEMWADFSSRRRNTQGRSHREPEDITAPELYVAFTPAAGIPAMGELTETGTGTEEAGYTGTGTGQEVDNPGKAVCNIYRLQQDFAGPELHQAGFKQTVYNLSRSSVPGHTYVLVARDKYGTWWSLVTGGQALQVSFDPSTCTITVIGADTTQGLTGTFS